MKILLICGGRSNEHAISLKSSQFIIRNLKGHQIETVIISKTGNLTVQRDEKIISQCALGNIQIWKNTESEFTCKIEDYSFSFNIVFPMLHGKFGEDGTIQGWLDLLDVPYVGCGVLSSAMCMDKDIAKRLVANSGIKIAKHKVLYKNNWSEDEHLIDNITYPVFVKPANSGSSIGVTKAHNKQQLLRSIQNAFYYDRKILIEQSIEGAREITIAILQNNDQLISGSGELVILNNGFYSYQAKYVDSGVTKFITPAPLEEKLLHTMKEASKLIFKLLGCSGIARVDFLLQEEKFFFMEINSMPGFTEISSFPLIFQKLGISFSQLLDILINNTLQNTKQY